MGENDIMSGKEPSAKTSADERAQIERARALANAGRLQEAELLFRGILEDDPDCVAAHSFFAALAFREGRPADAIAAYEKCIALQPGDAMFHVNLATLKEMTGDVTGAAQAYLAAYRLQPKDARFALFAGTALEAAGRREEAAIMLTLGDDVSPLIRAAKDQPKYPAEIRRRSAIADRVIREFLTGLHRRAVNEAEIMARHANAGSAPDLSRVRSAIWTQTHVGPVAFRADKQRPTIFYMPDLAPLAVTPRCDLPWAAAVEAATSEILGEYLAALERGVEMAPYVDANTRDPTWRRLRGQTDWSSLHLFKNGHETAAAKRFPKTLAALENADVFRLEGERPVEVFFSRLKPGTHIPPHVGTCNHRLTVHLPLIVPENCAIRVEETTHGWREGELFAFDDSFEHEAWNRSDTERVVLIFEAHRPEVSPAERLAIEHVFNVRERWLKERRIPEAN